MQAQPAEKGGGDTGRRACGEGPWEKEGAVTEVLAGEDCGEGVKGEGP